MKTLTGIGASDGIAIGKIHFLDKLDLSIKELDNQDITLEMKRFLDAQKKSIKELEQLYETTKINNEESAKVFEIHQMLITDLDFTEGVEALINQGKNAEWAVDATARKFVSLFEAMDDEVFRERAADVIDIRNRLIRVLKGIEENNTLPEGDFIILTEELLPSEIVKFDLNSVVGFVTKYGSRTSHAAIIARTLNIPIVMGLSRFNEIPHFGKIIINGKTGEVVINPSSKVMAEYEDKILKLREYRKSLEMYRGQKAITKAGHHVTIAANIGNLQDIDLVLKSDADAVGLFRSEFIYLETRDFPSEEKQFNIYKEVLSRLAPRNVIIRTLDIGADKTVDYFNLEKEENPALGYRAIRICLKEPTIFKTQLRALYRASVFGNLSIMFPMITHRGQVHDIKEIIEEVKRELKTENIPYDDKVKIGIMIETPSAVMISDHLAKMVDFFSIGTNDLTQYTMAVDRMNSKISFLFDQGHEAVLRMIALTAKNAHDAGIWVGICGESASDLNLLDFYLDHKIDELSVAPANVLVLKKEIIER